MGGRGEGLLPGGCPPGWGGQLLPGEKSPLGGAEGGSRPWGVPLGGGSVPPRGEVSPGGAEGDSCLGGVPSSWGSAPL